MSFVYVLCYRLTNVFFLFFHSRMTLEKEGWNIFKNLAEDEELFQSEGDYQFEVYR